MPYEDPDAGRAYHRKYYRDKVKPKRISKRVIEDRKVVVSLRLRASLVGRITGIFHRGIAEKTHNHGTPSDLYAEILIQGLDVMAANDENIAEAMQYLRAMNAADSVASARKEAQSAFSRTKIEIAEMLAIGETNAAHQFYWTTVATFEDFSPNIWRDWFLKAMAKAFPRFAAKRPKGVSLDPKLPDRTPKGERGKRASKGRLHVVQ